MTRNESEHPQGGEPAEPVRRLDFSRYHVDPAAMREAAEIVEETAARLRGDTTIFPIYTTERGVGLSLPTQKIVCRGDWGDTDFMDFERPETSVSGHISVGKPVIVGNIGGTPEQISDVARHLLEEAQGAADDPFIAHPLVEQGGPATPGTVLPGDGEIVSFDRPDPFRAKDRKDASGTGAAPSAEPAPKKIGRMKPTSKEKPQGI